MKKALIVSSVLFVAILFGCSKNGPETDRAQQESSIRSGECPGGDDEDPLPTLRGTVVDSLSLDSLQGVCVTLETDEYVFVAVIGTDNNGHYYFNEVANGAYQLVFSKSGYIDKTVPVMINSTPLTINAQLRLVP